GKEASHAGSRRKRRRSRQRGQRDTRETDDCQQQRSQLHEMRPVSAACRVGLVLAGLRGTTGHYPSAEAHVAVATVMTTACFGGGLWHLFAGPAEAPAVFDPAPDVCIATDPLREVAAASAHGAGWCRSPFFVREKHGGGWLYVHDAEKEVPVMPPPFGEDSRHCFTGSTLFVAEQDSAVCLPRCSPGEDRCAVMLLPPRCTSGEPACALTLARKPCAPHSCALTVSRCSPGEDRCAVMLLPPRCTSGEPACAL
ncbi:unnamed protein product, partial [Pylaiella littoralis]